MIIADEKNSVAILKAILTPYKLRETKRLNVNRLFLLEL